MYRANDDSRASAAQDGARVGRQPRLAHSSTALSALALTACATRLQIPQPASAMPIASAPETSDEMAPTFIWVAKSSDRVSTVTWIAAHAPANTDTAIQR